MAHHRKVRAAVEQCKDDDDAIIHFDTDMRMDVMFEDNVTLTAEKLIREHNFLIEPNCPKDGIVALY